MLVPFTSLSLNQLIINSVICGLILLVFYRLIRPKTLLTGGITPTVGKVFFTDLGHVVSIVESTSLYAGEGRYITGFTGSDGRIYDQNGRSIQAVLPIWQSHLPPAVLQYREDS